MERLALCSKVLYDYDLLDKQKEIYELKKIINTPKIFFENNKLWENKKEEMYETIKNIIYEFEDDYENIVYTGLSSVQRININHVLFDELNKLTEYKYSSWCNIKAYDIVYGVDSAIQALIYVDKINNFRDSEISEFIYKNIIWQLGDNSHYPSILDDIPIFRNN
jgi:hypothetical protein